MTSIITMKYYRVKIFCILIVIVFIAACNQTNNEDALDKLAVHFSGVFITQYVATTTSLRIKGKRTVERTGDSIFNVKGSVEGFTSFNVPVSIQQFSERVLYLGGDANKRGSWQCIDIYVGDKKMK